MGSFDQGYADVVPAWAYAKGWFTPCRHGESVYWFSEIFLISEFAEIQ
jgi:hypothetical protein